VTRRATIILLVSAAALAAGSAGASANQLTGCNNPADSALNQYCETIPTSTGGHRPVVGTPAVATTLPRTVVHQLLAARGARRAHRRLLTLPAAHRRLPLKTSNAATSSLSLWIILILALVALAVAAGVIADRRLRHRS
jgi:hypothetical protein